MDVNWDAVAAVATAVGVVAAALLAWLSIRHQQRAQRAALRVELYQRRAAFVEDVVGDIRQPFKDRSAEPADRFFDHYRIARQLFGEDVAEVVFDAGLTRYFAERQRPHTASDVKGVEEIVDEFRAAVEPYLDVGEPVRPRGGPSRARSRPPAPR